MSTKSTGRASIEKIKNKKSPVSSTNVSCHRGFLLRPQPNPLLCGLESRCDRVKECWPLCAAMIFVVALTHRELKGHDTGCAELPGNNINSFG